MTLGSAWVKAWVELTAASVSAHRDELIDLDRAIGDGDHGENLDRGFSEVMKQWSEIGDDPAAALKLVAMTLISKVGGASGPLFGTAYLRMASAVKEEINGATIAAMIEAGSEGVIARGKAEVGEKTMVDAWVPAAVKAKEAAEAGASAQEVLEAAAAAARTGADSTRDLMATKGRASYLGERSIGHRDPGAVSTAYILEAAVRAA